MAQAQVNCFVSDMRGKLGDVIYLRRNGQLLTKSYKKPHNPQTSYQTAVRNNWASLLSAWGSLTDTSRFTWKFAATQIFISNNTGIKFHPTAQQLYLSYNQNSQAFWAFMGQSHLPASHSRRFSNNKIGLESLPTAAIALDG